MSAIPATIVRRESANRPGALARLARACTDAIARHFIRRAAVARLREYDEHLLDDVGLERSQIEAAVYGAVTRSGRAKMR